MERLPLLKILYFTCCIILLWNCASIKAPPGGAVDEIPPTILEINPPSGSVNLVTRKIKIKFSEYMDETSFNNNIKIFPNIKSAVEFKFQGDDITLILPDSLDDEKTYIIYLNRNIKDEHNNPLANTLQLAFSTGGKINTGSIGGKIFGTGQQAVHLWNTNDTLSSDSIFAKIPDYVTDVSDEGRFSFNYLAAGIYQILAVEKSGSGLPLNTDLTKYGMHWKNGISIAEDDTLSNINLRLWQEPQKLKLIRGEWPAFNWGWLVFNNDLPDKVVANLRLQSDDGIIYDTFKYYLNPFDRKNLVIQLSDTVAQNSLNIFVDSIKSDSEILLDSAKVVVQIPQKADSSYLEIVKPTQNTQIIPDKNSKAELDLIFSKPVELSNDSFYWPKLFMNDSIAISMTINQINPSQIKLSLSKEWEENVKYKLIVNRDSFVPMSGRGLKDSTTTIKLISTKIKGYGAVIGRIDDLVQNNLAIELISAKNPLLSQLTFVNSESKFEFETIPEGNYSLYIFKDDDKDMKYSFGKAYPKTPSEWFFFYSDTFEVRANWDTEIPPIILPEIN